MGTIPARATPFISYFKYFKIDLFQQYDDNRILLERIRRGMGLFGIVVRDYEEYFGEWTDNERLIKKGCELIIAENLGRCDECGSRLSRFLRNNDDPIEHLGHIGAEEICCSNCGLIPRGKRHKNVSYKD